MENLSKFKTKFMLKINKKNTYSIALMETVGAVVRTYQGSARLSDWYCLAHENVGPVVV